MEVLSDSPRDTQFHLVSFPNLSRVDAVEADNIAGACETGLSPVVLLA